MKDILHIICLMAEHCKILSQRTQPLEVKGWQFIMARSVAVQKLRWLSEQTVGEKVDNMVIGWRRNLNRDYSAQNCA